MCLSLKSSDISKGIKKASYAPRFPLAILCLGEVRSNEISHLETANDSRKLYPLTNLVNENSEIRLMLLLAYEAK